MDRRGQDPPGVAGGQPRRCDGPEVRADLPARSMRMNGVRTVRSAQRPACHRHGGDRGRAHREGLPGMSWFRWPASGEAARLTARPVARGPADRSGSGCAPARSRSRARGVAAGAVRGCRRSAAPRAHPAWRRRERPGRPRAAGPASRRPPAPAAVAQLARRHLGCHHSGWLGQRRPTDRTRRSPTSSPSRPGSWHWRPGWGHRGYRSRTAAPTPSCPSTGRPVGSFPAYRRPTSPPRFTSSTEHTSCHRTSRSRPYVG